MTNLWHRELPTWKRGWAKRPVPNAPPTLVEMVGSEMLGITGGLYGQRDEAIERGWQFGPALPTPSECANIASLRARASLADEMSALLKMRGDYGIDGEMAEWVRRYDEVKP